RGERGGCSIGFLGLEFHPLILRALVRELVKGEEVAVFLLNTGPFVIVMTFKRVWQSVDVKDVLLERLSIQFGFVAEEVTAEVALLAQVVGAPLGKGGVAVSFDVNAGVPAVAVPELDGSGESAWQARFNEPIANRLEAEGVSSWPVPA